ncbi:YbeD family protein [Legionella tunisiensis]|uniref:YbeD family protein n=1 Tax=Legionella tunisiensis TaxID=1034944 RepID=UPI002FBD78FD
MTEIIHKHFPETPDKAIRHQESQHGNYLSITAVVHAKDQLTLDSLYRDLTKHPDIKMVL